MKKFPAALIGIVSFLLFGAPFGAHAASQSISVTPPLFQLSVKPGDIWQSSIRVVNPNEFPLTVYTEVVNFLPEGEGGMGRFVPVLRDDEVKETLAEWIEIPTGPFTIPPEQTQEITFFAEIPPDAAPGGHFAAVLVSTEPPPDTGDTLALVTTQTVTSLFFARIEGDVNEKGDIREFSVEDRSIELPEAEFSLRFENKGNVHVQPRGDIVITNMWGKERGLIPVNENTHFGNVLPNSVRDFRFSWKGERSLTDIGRYKAIATLAYGEDGVKSVTATTYFWVIPIKGALMTLTFLALFISAVSWMIRLYIRRMLALAGVDPDSSHTSRTASNSHERKADSEAVHAVRPSVAAPLRAGTLDLRARLNEADEETNTVTIVFAFIGEYRRFFIALTILILGIIALVFYVREVSNTDTEYEVTVTNGGESRTYTDEDMRGSDTKN